MEGRIIRKAFDQYRIQVYGVEKQVTDETALITCLRGGATVALLFFGHTREKSQVTCHLTPDSRDYTYLSINFPSSMLTPILDMLRNERSWFAYYAIDDWNGGIVTGSEPIGEMIEPPPSPNEGRGQ